VRDPASEAGRGDRGRFSTRRPSPVAGPGQSLSYPQTRRRSAGQGQLLPGNDPPGGSRASQLFEGSVSSVYPGVDMVSTERQSARIRFRHRPGPPGQRGSPYASGMPRGHALHPSLDTGGALILKTALRRFRATSSRAWQERGGAKIEVPSSYVLRPRGMQGSRWALRPVSPPDH